MVGAQGAFLIDQSIKIVPPLSSADNCGLGYVNVALNPSPPSPHESSRIYSGLMQARGRSNNPKATEGGPQPIERQGHLRMALPGAMAPDTEQV